LGSKCDFGAFCSLWKKLEKEKNSWLKLYQKPSRAQQTLEELFTRVVTPKFPSLSFDATKVQDRSYSDTYIHSYKDDRVYIDYLSRMTCHLGDYDRLVDCTITVDNQVIYHVVKE
jgi:hypothetical protein